MDHPGSFTKNLGFGRNGLGVLHGAIVDGQGHDLAPRSRKDWRFSCTSLDGDRQLVALNFFLCSAGKVVVVDELVRLALQSVHSPEWDLVALFALNLGQPGVGLRKGIPAETAWANRFIKTVVANADGTWDLSKITRATFDRFLEENMLATPKTRTKVRNNYLYILQLCGISKRRLLTGSPAPERWVPNALFVAWDRYMIRGLPCDLSLLKASIDDELDKVAGVRANVFWDIANDAIGTYISLGGLRRFGDH